MREVAVLLPPLNEPAPRVVRHPQEAYLLAQEVIAPADYLVARDADLLPLGGAAALLRIVRPAAFVRDILNAEDDKGGIERL